MAPGQTSLDEARAPCPVCGGAIHPIAGRCKHCRTDLVKLRAARPTLDASRLPSPLTTIAPSGTTIARRWRPTWPVVVAALATIAIVVSLLLLNLGSPRSEATPRPLPPPPAPDRMNVLPIPDPGQPSAPAPAPSDPDLDDPWQGGQAVPTRPSAGTVSSTEFVQQLSHQVCQRLTTCGLIDPGSGIDCSMVDQLGSTLLPGLASGDHCFYDARQAKTCLDALGTMPCPTSGALNPSGLGGLLMSCASLACATP